jgi:phosphoglycolate phosphatase
VREADAVLFDFDGTLAPNLDLPDLRRRVVNLTLAHGVPETAFTGRYIIEILSAGAQWLGDRGRDAAAAEALLRDGHCLIRDFEIDAAGRTAPFPDARDTLTALRNRGKSLGVVTRNCRDAVLTVFPDLENHCHSVLARDDVVHLKPDVRHLHHALDTLGRTPERTVMVGDGQMDMRIGRVLGLYCVGVLTGSSDAARLQQAGADVVLARMANLAQAWDLLEP